MGSRLVVNETQPLKSRPESVPNSRGEIATSLSSARWAANNR